MRCGPRACIAVAIGLALPFCGVAAAVASGGSIQWFVLGWLGPVVLIGLAALAWRAWTYELIRWKGIAVPARMISVERMDLGPADLGIWNWYKAIYSYTDQSGEEHVGTTRPIRTIPNAGENHEVRYDPHEPSRSVWIR